MDFMPFSLAIISIIVAFVLVDVAALRVGVDSRDESTDPASPAAGLF